MSSNPEKRGPRLKETKMLYNSFPPAPPHHSTRYNLEDHVTQEVFNQLNQGLFSLLMFCDRSAGASIGSEAERQPGSFRGSGSFGLGRFVAQTYCILISPFG